MFNINVILFIKDFQDTVEVWNLIHKNVWQYITKKKKEGSKMKWFFSFSTYIGDFSYYTEQTFCYSWDKTNA